MDVTHYADHLSLREPEAFFIGGEWAKATGPSRLNVIYPGNAREIASMPEASEDEIDRAVAAARSAFDNGPWPQMTGPERAGYLRQLAKAIRARADAIGLVWTLESGTTVMVAGQSAIPNAEMVDYYADLVETLPFHETRLRDPAAGAIVGGAVSGVGIVRRVPTGVVAAILPWNYPFGLALQTIVPALAAGCTVIYKPAPETPLHSWLLAECIEEAGFPAGVFNMVPAGREVGDRLVRHAGVDKVALTGSTAAGRHIASVCGSRLARTHLELGGKSPALILDDAEPADVVPNLLWTFTGNCGQMCAALTRLVVPRKRLDDYADAIAAGLNALTVGDPFDPTVWLGPLAMKRQHDRVFDYIAKGQAEGAKLVTGGGRPVGLDRGYFVEPTLFTDVTNDMTIARDEIFGPVGALIAHDGDEDAIRIANDSIYGLNGAVFSPDPERAFGVMSRVRAGNVTHNGWAVDSKFPFGGFRQSGIGRAGGPEGLFSFTEYQTLYMQAEPAALKTV